MEVLNDGWTIYRRFDEWMDVSYSQCQSVELTRFGQWVRGVVILLKELQDGSGDFEGVVSLASSDGGLTSIDPDLKRTQKHNSNP